MCMICACGNRANNNQLDAMTSKYLTIKLLRICVRIILGAEAEQVQTEILVIVNVCNNN